MSFSEPSAIVVQYNSTKSSAITSSINIIMGSSISKPSVIVVQ